MDKLEDSKTEIQGGVMVSEEDQSANSELDRIQPCSLGGQGEHQREK